MTKKGRGGAGGAWWGGVVAMRWGAKGEGVNRGNRRKAPGVYKRRGEGKVDVRGEIR